MMTRPAPHSPDILLDARDQSDGTTLRNDGGHRTRNRRAVPAVIAERALNAGALTAKDRASLESYHQHRLKLTRKGFKELLEFNAIRIWPDDDGEGALVGDLQSSAEIYYHAASRIKPDTATLHELLRLRRIYHLVTDGDVRPPFNVMKAAQRHLPANPSVHDFARILCRQKLAAALAREHKEEHGGSHRLQVSHRDASLSSLLRTLPDDLQSYLEARGFGKIRKVSPVLIAQLNACSNETVRGLGVIYLERIMRQAYSRHLYHKMLILKQFASAASKYHLPSLQGIDDFAWGYCIEGTIYPQDPMSRRTNVGHFILESHVFLEQEIRHAEPKWRDMLHRYLLPLPRMPDEFARRIRKAQRKQIADGRQERKDRVEPLIDNLPALRFIAGSRTAELQHDERCCAAAIREAEKLDVSGAVEMSFRYQAPIFDADGRRLPGLQWRHWTLRNTNRCLEMRMMQDPDGEKAKRLPGNRLHEERYNTEWWLFFDRCEAIDGAETREPWAKELVDSCILFSGRGLRPEIVTGQLAFAQANDLDEDIVVRLPPGVGWYESDQRKRARWIIEDLGLRPFPVIELTYGMQIANAGTRVMTGSGARMHELIQLMKDPSRLFRIDSLPGDEERYIFLAIPKGLEDPVPFVLGRDDLKAVMEVAQAASRRWHKGGPIPETDPPAQIGHKCGRGRYLINCGSRPLSPSEINPLIQLLFSGHHELEAYDLRHTFASYAEGVGIPIEVIGAWLNQKSLDITRYYARASREARNQWLMQLHTVVSLDELKNFDAVKSDARKVEALEQVGALTSVPGGTCVSLGECPARFSCIGCGSNAADPDKREEVEESLKSAIALQETWDKRGRVKAAQEQERSIERHHAMLREMEAIERYRELRDEAVEPCLETRVSKGDLR